MQSKCKSTMLFKLKTLDEEEYLTILTAAVEFITALRRVF